MKLFNKIKSLFTKKQPVSKASDPIPKFGDWRIDKMHLDVENYLNKLGFNFKWRTPLEFELYDEKWRLLARVKSRVDIADFNTVVGLLPRRDEDKERFVNDGWLYSANSISWKYLPLWNVCYYARDPERFIPLYELTSGR